MLPVWVYLPLDCQSCLGGYCTKLVRQSENFLPFPLGITKRMINTYGCRMKKTMTALIIQNHELEMVHKIYFSFLLCNLFFTISFICYKAERKNPHENSIRYKPLHLNYRFLHMKIIETPNPIFNISIMLLNVYNIDKCIVIWCLWEKSKNNDHFEFYIFSCQVETREVGTMLSQAIACWAEKSNKKKFFEKSNLLLQYLNIHRKQII